MKRLKLVSAVVLIMVLGFTGFSHEQNNTRETADELLGNNSPGTILTATKNFLFKQIPFIAFIAKKLI